MDTKMNNKEQMIKELRARLNWFLYEADVDEFNEEEVLALINLINVTDPAKVDEDYYKPEKALERFWKSYELRNEIYEEFEKLKAGEVSVADYPDDEELTAEIAAAEAAAAERAAAERVAAGCDVLAAQAVGGSAEGDALAASADNGVLAAETKTEEMVDKSGKIRKFASHKGFTKMVTAAALVVAVFLGGTVGVYAEKEGFFHWTKKDDEGTTAVISAELSDVGTGMASYDSFETMPEKYQEVVWKPSAMPEELVIEKIEILSYRVMTDIESSYIDKETNKFVRISQKIFNGELATYDSAFDSFEHVLTESYDFVNVQYLKTDNDGVTEYVVDFCVGNEQYTIKSNLDMEEVRMLVSISIKDII